VAKVFDLFETLTHPHYFMSAWQNTYMEFKKKQAPVSEKQPINLIKTLFKMRKYLYMTDYVL
jgi:hypothetical protein